MGPAGAFSLRRDDGTLALEGRSFPEVCHHLFGLTLPRSVSAVDVEGWVLRLSMAQARAFGPYRPDAGMLTLCRRTAEGLWATVRAVKAGHLGLDEIETCSGFHPLRAWCDHAHGCPKFTADPVKDLVLDQALAEFTKLKADKAALEAEIDSREAKIRQFCRRSGADQGSGWLSTSRFRFRTSRMNGRKTLDPGRLRAELTNRLGEREADALIDRATTQGAAFERLTVTALKLSSRNESSP